MFLEVPLSDPFLDQSAARQVGLALNADPLLDISDYGPFRLLKQPVEVGVLLEGHFRLKVPLINR